MNLRNKQKEQYLPERPETSGSAGENSYFLVDDGIAPGNIRLHWSQLRKMAPESMVLAVPVASMEAVSGLKQDVDELVCLLVPDVFYAVGQFYKDLRQTTDEEVINVMKELA